MEECATDISFVRLHNNKKKIESIMLYTCIIKAMPSSITAVYVYFNSTAIHFENTYLFAFPLDLHRRYDLLPSDLA